MSTTSVNIVCEQIRHHDNIAISGHEFPDGDSIGACLALAIAINGMGKKVWAVIDDCGEKYKVIPGQQFIYRGDVNELNPGLFICVDCPSPDRLGKAAVLLEKTTEVVCIDHHKNDGLFAKYNYIDSDASAACELVFHVLDWMGIMSPDTASAIYAGIVYDTGGFLHQNTTPECLDIVSGLISLGIPFTNIYNVMLKERTLNAAKMFGLVLSRLKLQGGICYSYITQQDLISEGATIDDLDQISNELLTTKDAVVSVFVYEKSENFSKASFRSRDIDVREIAKSFGGGGHERAAGANMYSSAKEALPVVIEKIREAIDNCEK